MSAVTQTPINALMSNGIYAATGSECNAPYVDIVTMGAVWIEVLTALQGSERGQAFQFVSTPRQRELGYMAHVLMLECVWDSGAVTYHLFDAIAPPFYIDGRVKTSVVYRPGKLEPSITGRGNQWQLTQPVMDAAQDDYNLVWTWLAHIRQALLKGKRPEYGKVFK